MSKARKLSKLLGSDNKIKTSEISNTLGFVPQSAADITNAINALINSAPGALNTLSELASALGNDANFATTVTNTLATKASITDVNTGLDSRLSKNSNLSDISNATTARLNLGLATIASTGSYTDLINLPNLQAFPQGTRLPFAQSSAPTGWTQDTSDNANNRMLRVVNTTGNSIGGSHSPILNNVVPSHTHGFTTGTESADHGHSGNTGTVSSDHTHSVGYYMDDDNGDNGYVGIVNGDNAFYYGYATGGASANHTHGFSTGGRSAAHTHSGTTDNGSSQTNWTPRYIDMIICSKN